MTTQIDAQFIQIAGKFPFLFLSQFLFEPLVLILWTLFSFGLYSPISIQPSLHAIASTGARVSKNEI